MFIQVITGAVGDADGLAAASDRWAADLRPGAPGFLGSTEGITRDGTYVCFARFVSVEAAQANSQRPEQDAWWSETMRCFSGPVAFRDCPEVDLYRDGGRDDAGFVQVMQGHADRARLQAFDAQMNDRLPELRPDLLGSVRAWSGDEYTEASYFTSEAEARAAERQEPPPDVAAALSQWQEVMGPVTYYDLPSPRFLG
jgi:hypothetical protein